MSQDSDDAPLWMRAIQPEGGGKEEEQESDEDIPEWMKQYKVCALVQGPRQPLLTPTARRTIALPCTALRSPSRPPRTTTETGAGAPATSSQPASKSRRAPSWRRRPTTTTTRGTPPQCAVGGSASSLSCATEGAGGARPTCVRSDTAASAAHWPPPGPSLEPPLRAAVSSCAGGGLQPAVRSLPPTARRPAARACRAGPGLARQRRSRRQQGSGSSSRRQEAGRQGQGGQGPAHRCAAGGSGERRGGSSSQGQGPGGGHRAGGRAPSKAWAGVRLVPVSAPCSFGIERTAPHWGHWGARSRRAAAAAGRCSQLGRRSRALGSWQPPGSRPASGAPGGGPGHRQGGLRHEAARPPPPPPPLPTPRAPLRRSWAASRSWW
jgi:hypothetical protein